MKREHSDDQGVDGIKPSLLEIAWEGIEWTHVAQVRDWWWALVNTVMNLWVLTPHS
jgi:hypothetical protein